MIQSIGIHITGTYRKAVGYIYTASTVTCMKTGQELGRTGLSHWIKEEGRSHKYLSLQQSILNIKNNQQSL